jgi:hypothetical protein
MKEQQENVVKILLCASGTATTAAVDAFLCAGTQTKNDISS